MATVLTEAPPRVATAPAVSTATSRTVDCSAPAIAPVRGWRTALADSFVVGGATLICQALGVVTSIAFRALLDPAQIGIWQGLKLALEYGNYASLGVSKGATRELTIALGSGDRARADRLAHLGFTFNMLTSVSYSALMLLAAGTIWYTSATSYPLAWSCGLAGMALLAILQRHVSFDVTVLRAQQAFRSTSLLNLLEAACMLIVGASAVWLWGLPGLYLATGVTLLASWRLLYHVRRRAYRWHWDAAEIGRLATIGAPILLIAVCGTAMRSLDRWLILGFSPDREFELGVYSLALLVTTQLSGVANVFAIVMGPRYGELLGSSGQTAVVARLAARLTEVKALAMLLPGIATMTIGPLVLVALLPGYEAGLSAMLIRVPGVVARALAIPANQLLITIDHQRRALAAMIPPFIVGLLAAWYAHRQGWGLIGIAWAMTASDLVYLAVQAAVAFCRALRPTQQFRYAGMLLLGIVPLLILAVLRVHTSFGVAGAWQAALLLAISLSAWSLVALWAWWRGGWSDVWRKERACNA